MRVFGLKNCDTCRKALAELRRAGHTPDFVDVRRDPPDAATLARFLDAFGEALVNRRSTTWRGLGPEERALPPARLLAAHPALMKRPVIDVGGRLYLGWGAETRAALVAP